MIFTRIVEVYRAMLEESGKQSALTESDSHGGLVDFLLGVVTSIPASEKPMSTDPRSSAEAIVKEAAWRAAGTSGALALPPGPLGLATILPDLMAIWRIQQQMVADIARVYGKEAVLTREVMAYCLFKHGAAMLVRDLVVRAGERYLIRPVALRGLVQILQKIGVATTQKAMGRIASRWVPVLGALAVAAYARWDTQQVGKTAMETFEGRLELPEPGECVVQPTPGSEGNGEKNVLPG